MANHVRQQIREVAATTLTGLATTGSRVFQSRVYPLTDAQLPALVVYTNEEQAEVSAIGFPALLNRQLNLQVIAKAKANANLEDTLDTIIKEVETALNASVAANTFGGLAKQTDLSSIYIEMGAEAEKPIGQAVMSFTVQYKTQAHAPNISI